MRTTVRLAIRSTALSLAATSAAVAAQRWQRWQQRWGATDAEVAGTLPGDDTVAEPASNITRAITIEAPPERVWPWLVQLGADRGGFYSYDWLENAVGLQVHSAGDVVPAWQHLAVGDVVYATRRRTGGWYVARLDPDQTLVLKVADVKAGRPLRREDAPGWEFAWIFVLRRLPGDRTRLLVRERVAFGRARTRLVMAPVGPISFVMTRRMLLGVKRRAEGVGTVWQAAPDEHAERRTGPGPGHAGDRQGGVPQ